MTRFAYFAAASVGGDVLVMCAFLVVAWAIASFGVYQAEPLWNLSRARRLGITISAAIILAAILGGFGYYEYAHRPIDGWKVVLDYLKRHDCDARCMNATGRTMNCECACGGRNHGKGRVTFNCEPA